MAVDPGVPQYKQGERLWADTAWVSTEATLGFSSEAVERAVFSMVSSVLVSVVTQRRYWPYWKG